MLVHGVVARTQKSILSCAHKLKKQPKFIPHIEILLVLRAFLCNQISFRFDSP